MNTGPIKSPPPPPPPPPPKPKITHQSAPAHTPAAHAPSHAAPAHPAAHAAHGETAAQHQAAAELGARHAATAAPRDHAAGFLGGLFNTVSRADGALQNMALRASVKPITAHEAQHELSSLHSELSHARNARDVATLSQRANELQGRAMVSNDPHLSHALRHQITSVRNAADNAHQAMTQLAQIHSNLHGTPEQRASQTAQLLAHPGTLRGTLRGLGALNGSPALAHAQHTAQGIADHATPDALAKQLKKEPNLAAYGPGMANNLGALRGMHNGHLQHALDGVAHNLLDQSQAAHQPLTPGTNGSIFDALGQIASGVARGVAGDPLSYAAVKANPGLGRLIAPLQASHNPATRAQVQDTVSRWASQSLLQNIDAHHTGLDPKANQAASAQGFQNDMVSMVKQMGIEPKVAMEAMNNAPAAAGRTLLTTRNVGVTDVQRNPLYGQMMAAAAQKDPSLQGQVTNQIKEWTKQSMMIHLQGKQQEDGIKKAQAEMLGDIKGIAQSTGLGGDLLKNGVQAAFDDKDLKKAMNDTANKGKDFLDKLGDLAGGFLDGLKSVAGDALDGLGALATGHLGDAVGDFAHAGSDGFGATMHLAGGVFNLGMQGLGNIGSGFLRGIGAGHMADDFSHLTGDMGQMGLDTTNGLGQLANDAANMSGDLAHGHIGGAFADAGKGWNDAFSGVGKVLGDGGHLLGDQMQMMGDTAGTIGGAGLRALGAKGLANDFQSATHSVGKFYGGVANGLGDGLAGMAQTVGFMGQHPLAAVTGMGALITHPGRIPAMAKAFMAQADKGGFAHAVGYIGAQFLPALLTDGGSAALTIADAGARTLGRAAFEQAGRIGLDGALTRGTDIVGSGLEHLETLGGKLGKFGLPDKLETIPKTLKELNEHFKAGQADLANGTSALKELKTTARGRVARGNQLAANLDHAPRALRNVSGRAVRDVGGKARQVRSTVEHPREVAASAKARIQGARERRAAAAAKRPTQRALAKAGTRRRLANARRQLHAHQYAKAGRELKYAMKYWQKTRLGNILSHLYSTGTDVVHLVTQPTKFVEGKIEGLGGKFESVGTVWKGAARSAGLVYEEENAQGQVGNGQSVVQEVL